VGQERSSQLYQVIILVTAFLGFVVGFFLQNFYVTSLSILGGCALAVIVLIPALFYATHGFLFSLKFSLQVTVPPYPFYTKNPLPFKKLVEPPTAEEPHPNAVDPSAKRYKLIKATKVPGKD